jgi:two-component system sensor histidine kinase BaeS
MQLEALEDGALEHSEKSYSSLQKKLGNLNHMVGNLYQLSLVESDSLVLNKQDVLIGPIVAESIESFQSLAHKAKLSISYQQNTDENIFINADAERLLQVFNNLLKNSIRYTDSNGEIKVSLFADINDVLITFEDTSPGVTDKDIAYLFNRLYRAEKTKALSSSGSGLGLSIVNSMVNAHDGKVTAEHSSLGGLNITVKLPRIYL